ncbi:putative ATP-dependent RNA helicase DHR1 [Friedmanniomyces endolithicus]|nr:putative ATP-dependent RNA helicase DHR1 [Friedmanniomyces endolithicus]KAK0835408.1 putative ATP-dependent RNA helicase DHR1 [Friedmanniomyces endolithicus]KAK0863696.1 putative ATP-dependent RNA helicase DHR1 [Friedmanniomyces endolithicus]KAK0875318.1 putative ATP-dependent RNA helicase DHR1 [Friedmanniomyces endolithicus]KAK0894010.1 putative ATP-dependent RNA helicase DHR1 [Friedmanniomyces endolithicus]
MAKHIPRERKHKRLAKRPQNQVEASAQPAPDEIIPETKTEREIRRTTIAEEVRSQQPLSKVSSKKRKRLDKYVDTKLRKEENLELLKKLAAHKVDTSLLQSSKKLGRVLETKRERFSRALREKQAGINDARHDDVLYERRREMPPVEVDENGDASEDEDGEVSVIAPPAVQEPTPMPGFGSGLKRPLETNDSGQPVIKKRKRRRKAALPSSPSPEYPDDNEDSVESTYDTGDMSESENANEWHGFGSDEEAEPQGTIIAKHGIPADTGEESEGSGTSEDELNDENSEVSSTGAGGEDQESDSESAPSAGSDHKERVSAFKQWANAQRNTALDFTPSALPADSAAVKANFRPRQPSPDPFVPAQAQMNASISQTNGARIARPSAAITIPRSEQIQAARLELPVVQEEQKIMEAIHGNPIVIVCGATGSGKTTQVPQMMFESGYGSQIGIGSTSSGLGMQSKGMIGVTQPRRVAATSVAERVATELGPKYRNRVAHQVRYDTNVSRDTAIKFMTDGILLREISQDFLLSRYSAIVIDEAHERSVNTDILIGMLSRIVPLREELAREEPEKHYPLKLVIMSATLRVADFVENTRLFQNGPPPIIEAEGRQYPVTVHFSRRTQRDYAAETVEKVARGHRKLPPGGILVFLTSQVEIQSVANTLKTRLGGGSTGFPGLGRGVNGEGAPLDMDDFEDRHDRREHNDYLDGEEDADSDSDIVITGLDPDASDKEFQVEDHPLFGTRERGALKPHILPLYAALPSAQQLRVFHSPPDGSRLIVLATNVAETSLTIPGIRYVFDCGRAKEKRHDNATGVQTFEIDWISKASASQRTGRAGRTGPGHCYRLYSSAVYERDFAEHTVPEILRTPLESTVLQLKSMEIENVVNFPFPTSPDGVQLMLAERLLRTLGAIGNEQENGRITELGKEVMGFPVNPRFGKMLMLAQRNGVLAYTVAIVAGLAVGVLFVPEAQSVSGVMLESGLGAESDEDSDREVRHERKLAESEAHTAAQHRHQSYNRAHAILSRWDDQSDVLKLLTAVAVHADASGPSKPISALSKICADYYLREKGMSEVQQLRHQLHNIVSARYSAAAGTITDALPVPSERERKLLGQVVAAAYIDQVAIRADLLHDETAGGFGRKPRRAGEVAYRTLVPTTDVDKTLSPQEQEMQRSVFVHPSSVLAHLSVKEMPGYIVYSHLSRAAPATIDSGKIPRTRIHPLTAVSAQVLAALAEGTPLLEMGKPIGKIGELGGGRRQCWVSMSLKAPSGSNNWPLSAWKVVQRKGKREAFLPLVTV